MFWMIYLSCSGEATRLWPSRTPWADSLFESTALRRRVSIQCTCFDTQTQNLFANGSVHDESTCRTESNPYHTTRILLRSASRTPRGLLFWCHKMWFMHLEHARFILNILISRIYTLKAKSMHYSVAVLRSASCICLNEFSCKTVWSLSSWFCWAGSFLEQTPTENASLFQIKSFRAKSKLTEKIYALQDSGAFWITVLTDLYRSRNSCKHVAIELSGKNYYIENIVFQ